MKKSLLIAVSVLMSFSLVACSSGNSSSSTASTSETKQETKTEEKAEVKDEIKGCESIVLGNMAKREDTNHQMSGATGIFYMSDQDIEELNSLVNEGFKVMFQQLPTTPCIDFETYYKTI